MTSFRGVAVLLFALAIAVGASNALAQSAPTLRQAESLVFRETLRRAEPWIVRIDTIGGALPVESAQGEDDTVRRASGFRPADGPSTGVIWSSDGYILTSTFNFVRDPSVISVSLSDQRRFVARLVARDRPASIALLKIDVENLPTPVLIESSKLRPGQRVIAVGFGHSGDRPAPALGIVSGLNRLSGLAVQTDARTSPAQYGGPLLDLDARLIGICVPFQIGEQELQGAQLYDAGVAFAIDTRRITTMMDRLKAGRDIERGFMGVVVDDREGPPAGMLITADPVGPAAAGGLLKGDIITSIDGIATTATHSFRRALMAKAADDKISVAFVRDAARQAVELTLVRREDLPPPSSQPATAPAGTTTPSGE